MADSLSALSCLLRAIKNYDEAESLASQALAIAEEQLGQDHPLVARILDNLAVIYFEQQEFAKAEPLYRRAVAIQEETLGRDHPDLAASLSDYAILLRKTHRKKQGAHMETLARNILSRNPPDRMAQLTIDVRQMEPQPKSFLPR